MHRVELYRLPAHQDLPGRGLLGAGQQRDQRGFAGAVLAEQDMDLAGAQLEIDAGPAPVTPGYSLTMRRHSTSGRQPARRVRSGGVAPACDCLCVWLMRNARTERARAPAPHLGPAAVSRP